MFATVVASGGMMCASNDFNVTGIIKKTYRDGVNRQVLTSRHVSHATRILPLRKLSL